MNITMTKQNKHDNEIVIWAGSWDASNYNHGTPADAIISFYQFWEGYEPVGWIANNITEDEFNALYNSGRRLFWLEDTHEYISVLIEEITEEITERFNYQDLEYKANLLDELIIHSYNVVNGFMDQSMFKEIIEAYEELEATNNKKVFEAKIEDIEDRLEEED